MKMAYSQDSDVLHLAISNEAEAESVEVSPNVMAELNAEGALIGIEILEASKFIRDSILESVQGRLWNWESLAGQVERTYRSPYAASARSLI